MQPLRVLFMNRYLDEARGLEVQPMRLEIAVDGARWLLRASVS